MYLAYIDESGDDGFPKYSSEIFVLTSLYVHYQNWKDTFDSFYQFRQALKTTINLPIRWEFHTKPFLLNKRPYTGLGLSDKDRVEVMDFFCDFLSSLSARVVNVTINKTAVSRSSNYDVLDNALTYTIQRLENDLNRIDPSAKFLIITDEGRVGKMRKTARKVQRINYIPSLLQSGTHYRRDIKLLIEDPLPKESSQSYFVQASDLISFVVYHYSRSALGMHGFPGRMPSLVTDAKVIDWMNRLTPILNTDASRRDAYGVVCYPR